MNLAINAFRGVRNWVLAETQTVFPRLAFPRQNLILSENNCAIDSNAVVKFFRCRFSLLPQEMRWNGSNKEPAFRHTFTPSHVSAQGSFPKTLYTEIAMADEKCCVTLTPVALIYCTSELALQRRDGASYFFIKQACFWQSFLLRTRLKQAVWFKYIVFQC